MASASLNHASRVSRAIRINARHVEYVERVLTNVHLGVAIRMKLVGQQLRDAVVFNISRPVTKILGGYRTIDPISGQATTKYHYIVEPGSRSKPGEFPKADTTRLMKDIFFDFDEEQLIVKVGTTLDYGLYLETQMDRSFLRKTLNQMLPWVELIFTEHPTGAQISSALESAKVSATDSGAGQGSEHE